MTPVGSANDNGRLPLTVVDLMETEHDPAVARFAGLQDPQ
jgi:hypothetical protein